MTEKDKQDSFLRPLDADDLSRIYAEGKHVNNCIGYLRGYFYRNDKEFRHTWVDKHVELKTPDFKLVFDRYIYQLVASGALISYDTMAAYCSDYPETPGDFLSGPNYCFVTEMEGYIFCLRCILCKGDYNFYIFCYISEGADGDGAD